MAMSKPVQDKVKERIRQGKSKVKARSRVKFNNSNSFFTSDLYYDIRILFTNLATFQ